MEQKMITMPYPTATTKINELLDQGWNVVPGTIAMKVDKVKSGLLILTATVQRRVRFNPFHPSP